MKLKRFFSDLLFTRRCIGCNELLRIGEDNVFCENCAPDFRPTDDKLFYVEGVEFLKAYCAYEGAIRKALRRFKFYNDGTVGRFFAERIAEMIRNEKLIPKDFVIVPVPGNIAKSDREYVQAEFLAKKTAKLLGAECLCNIVTKKRSVKSQTKCKTAAERRNNIKGAFRISAENAEKIEGRNILIIDDISTTGATVTEMSDTLHRAGAAKIYAGCAAKTPAPSERRNQTINPHPQNQKSHTIV